MQEISHAVTITFIYLNVNTNIMSYVKLTKSSYETNEKLKNFIDITPEFRTPVLIMPRADLWKKFNDHVINIVGKKRTSRMVNYLLDGYVNKNGKSKQLTSNMSDHERPNINLSVDAIIWKKFIAKLERTYGKKKIQSEVIDMIIEDYFKSK